MLGRAIELDPRFGLAKAQAARCYAWRNAQGWAADPQAERAKATGLAREAVEFAGDDPTVLWMAGFALWQLRVDFDGAVELYDRAIALNPSSAQALTLRGWSFAAAAEPDEAIKLLEQARRLSPVDPEAFFTMSAMGFAYMTLGRFGEALGWTRRALRERPTFGPALRFHAICLAELGRIDEAQSIFGNAGSAVVVVERRVREWRGALLAKLAEAGARVAILRRVGGSAAHGSWEGFLAPSRAFRTKPNSAYVITALAVAVVAARDLSCRFQ